MSALACITCGAVFDSIAGNMPCSVPSPGREYVDTGRGNHIFKDVLAYETDAVDHPPHYSAGGIEAIDVIEAFGLNFRLGNAIKYILRAGRKAATVEDLKKARWYLDREIAKAGTP